MLAASNVTIMESASIAPNATFSDPFQVHTQQTWQSLHQTPKHVRVAVHTKEDHLGANIHVLGPHQAVCTAVTKEHCMYIKLLNLLKQKTWLMLVYTKAMKLTYRKSAKDNRWLKSIVWQGAHELYCSFALIRY